MSRRPEVPRWVDAIIGVGYAVLLAGVVGGATLMYNQAFTDSVDVTLETDTLGSALQKGSDVKYQGVPVGRVSKIESVPGGAKLSLALDPDTADELPTATTARLLPKTLFGERYVSLQSSVSGTGGGLSTGDTIQQDASDEAAELEEVLDELLPLLQSIQPDKLQAALGELATMLRGRGDQLGDTISDWGDYMTKLQPQVPQLADDLAKLGEVADVYADAAPDLLAALDSFTTPSATAARERATLEEVYARVIGAADESGSWVDANEDRIYVLSRDGRKALEATAPYATEFPCLLKSFADFIPEMDKTLGKDSDEPGIHVRLNVVEGRQPYKPGKDTPRWSKNGKPRCPYVTGKQGTQSVSAAAVSTDDEAPERLSSPAASTAKVLAAAEGLGPANSPEENQLIAEVMSAQNGTAVADYPDWGSLLVGPLLRGEAVTVE